MRQPALALGTFFSFSSSHLSPCQVAEELRKFVSSFLKIFSLLCLITPQEPEMFLSHTLTVSFLFRLTSAPIGVRWHLNVAKHYKSETSRHRLHVLPISTKKYISMLCATNVRFFTALNPQRATTKPKKGKLNLISVPGSFSCSRLCRTSSESQMRLEGRKSIIVSGFLFSFCANFKDEICARHECESFNV